MKLRLFCLCVVTLGLLQGDHVFVAEETYRGGLVTPPLPKPRFTLTDTSGAPFDFRRQTDGYLTRLFFGYARCPDECALHMANISLGLKRLPPSGAITSSWSLSQPIRQGHSQSAARVAQSIRQAFHRAHGKPNRDRCYPDGGGGVAAKAARAGEDYAVGHANFVLAYTTDNLAHVIYPGGVTQQDWAHDLPQLVTETWSSR